MLFAGADFEKGSSSMKSFVDKLTKPVYILSRVVWYFSIVVTVILTTLVIAQVIMRYCFNFGRPWIEEICMICLMWMAFFCGSMVFYDQTAINVTIVTDRLPLKTYKIVSIVFHIMTICFFVFLIIYGFKFAKVGTKMIFASSGLKKATAYLSIPIGSIVMLIFELYHTLKTIVEPPHRPEPEKPAEIEAEAEEA